MSARLPRRGLFGIAAAGALAGCGFQPVYMPTASGKPGVAARELAAVDVHPIQDRPGQLLRQALQERFASDGDTRHRYDLKVDFWIAGESIGILPDTTASRVRLTGTANWTLTARDATRSALASGSARVLDGFNQFDTQYFATVLETEKVEQRIAEAVADQVAMQLAIWFRKRANPAVG